MKSGMNEVLTSKEVAARLRIAEGTLINWRAQGKGPKFYKLHDGAKAPVRYKLQDVIEYEERHAPV